MCTDSAELLGDQNNFQMIMDSYKDGGEGGGLCIQKF